MPLSRRGRGKLLADSGRLLHVVIDRTAAAMELPPRGVGCTVAVYGAREQHHRVADAMRVLEAGGDEEAFAGCI